MLPAIGRPLIYGMLIGAGMLLGSSAGAQDFGGLNPADIGQGMVMPSAVAAQAKMNGRGGMRRGTVTQRQACARLDRFRAEYGESNGKVRQLTRLCRRAGLAR